jgi:hypothetical protein
MSTRIDEARANSTARTSPPTGINEQLIDDRSGLPETLGQEYGSPGPCCVVPGTWRVAVAARAGRTG